MAATNDPNLSRTPWRKSTYSGNGNNCVEVAAEDGRVSVRDTTDRDGTAETFSGPVWRSFMARVKRGEV